VSFSKKTIRDIEVNGKRVLVRAPLNVPIKDGKVTEEMRLEAVIPTLKYLLDHRASIVLLSHHSKEGVSLKPVVEVLGSLLNHPVSFITDALSDVGRQKIQAMKPGDMMVAENLRFHKEEEANDESFAKSLAGLGDVYVDDDFTVMHREHASVVGIPKHLPAVAGLLVEKEVTTITGSLENPDRPLLAIIGGAKISTKIELLDNLLPKVEAILVGGAMANTFLAAAGKPIGKSLNDPEDYELAHRIVKEAQDSGISLFLPTDVVVTTDIESAADVRTVDVDEVGENDIIADVGPQTVRQLDGILAQKGTVIWNGPMGIFETDAFRSGSQAVAEAVIDSGAKSIVGGGDTAAFIDSAGLTAKFTFVSTGGGASLELMSAKPLPGLEALNSKE
jgi:phosphoglycerate kinase